MSQKSTARTGSEGDAEFKATRNTDIHSGSSSCKTKRDIFGGPFGDSPFINQAQEPYQDYLVIMLRNNDDTPGTSESSQAEQDLYNLRHNYTEQLNLVRKKLNLMELEEEPQRCTITEIVETEPDSSKKDENVQVGGSSTPQRQTLSDLIAKEMNRREEYELTTIHPFSLSYNLESGSSTNIFEPDYSPPKKKVCQRMKTPRLVSLSEASIPYHTKVGIHESVFQKQTGLDGKKDKALIEKSNLFSETRETQCNEDDINKSNIEQCSKRPASNSSQSNSRKFSILNLSFDSETETFEESVYSDEKQTSDATSKSSERPKTGVIFPTVIIENKKKSDKEESSLSSRSKKYTTTSSSNKDTFRKDSDNNVLSLNSVREGSDYDTCTVKKMNTIIETSEQKSKSRKKPFVKQNKISGLEGSTMWEDLNRLRSGTDNKIEKKGDGDIGETGDATYDMCKLTNYVSQLSQSINLGEFIRNESEKSIQCGGKARLNRYIRQYVQYKREVEGIKQEPTKTCNKHTIIGQRLVTIENRIMDSPDKLYQSENSLVSDEDHSENLSATPSGTTVNDERRNIWERFCVCLCPGRYLAD